LKLEFQDFPHLWSV